MTSDEQLAALADEIDALSERLADRALELLREAMASGTSGAAAAEKRVTRARRALEKAASLLRGSS